MKFVIDLAADRTLRSEAVRLDLKEDPNLAAAEGVVERVTGISSSISGAAGCA